MENWNSLIFSDQSFEKKALKVFQYQCENNAVYRRYCEALSYSADDLKESGARNFPLLPIKAFKDAEISCMPEEEHELYFQSSGTTAMHPSKHQISDTELYRQSVLRGFNQFYNLDNAVILGYTPGYSENPHSSLIWMINELIKQDKIKKSRFLPLDQPLSSGEIKDISASGRQLIIFGAAFGLMDLLEMRTVTLPSNSVVIETGGMKTHHREISRYKLHRRLAAGFGLNKSRIHSEYGMCELLSQAYAIGGKWFKTVPWMKVTIRNPKNPFEILPPNSEGLIGVVDLANVYSCSFLLTGDRGTMDKNERFQVLGRWNPKDFRGCNFLMEEE